MEALTKNLVAPCDASLDTFVVQAAYVCPDGNIRFSAFQAL